MQNWAKLQLSAKEKEVVNNTEWILTKHAVIKKVCEMFGEITNSMKKELACSYLLFPQAVKYHGGKISRGENYQLLPYVILDYPSFFERNNVFAVRTMFWWGNFFSVTLHLSGAQKVKYINNNPAIALFLKNNDFSICVNKEEWQHHFEKENYMPAANVSSNEYQQILEKPFIKVAKKISLTEWNRSYVFIVESFKQILELLQINYPAGKKDLSPGFPTIGFGL